MVIQDKLYIPFHFQKRYTTVKLHVMSNTNSFHFDQIFYG